jgi:pyridoxamine 5'-phosphate oxidase
MSLEPHPIARFQELFNRAAGSAPFDHTAMTLATCDEAGRPAARVVLLHGLDDRGFVFYTNYESRKGLEIEANPWGALVFYWPWLDEQVRIEGTVVRLSDEESDAYFASRPRGKQVGAWASRQSHLLDSREVLEQRCADVEARFVGKNVPRPPFWGGYRLEPDRMEFWKQGEHRLHDRFRYEREGDAWTMVRLYP